MGGAKLELLLADTQSKPDVAHTEAERLINAGVQILQGPFSSGDAAAIVPVVQQRRVPFLVDIAAADPITANVAKAVKDGQQKVQYVYRNFPTGSSFGRRAVQYFNEIFKEAGVAPKRLVLVRTNDLFGQSQARGFVAAHKAAAPAWEIVDVIPWPEPPSDLSTEVARARSLKPDIIAPITRPASAQLLLPELAKQRVEVLGVVSPGDPGLYEAGGTDRRPQGAPGARAGQRAVAGLPEPADAAGGGGVREALRRQDLRYQLRLPRTTGRTSSPTRWSGRSRPTRTPSSRPSRRRSSRTW